MNRNHAFQVGYFSLNSLSSCSLVSTLTTGSLASTIHRFVERLTSYLPVIWSMALSLFVGTGPVKLGGAGSVVHSYRLLHSYRLETEQ